jgi:hypothetical protein
MFVSPVLCLWRDLLNWKERLRFKPILRYMGRDAIYWFSRGRRFRSDIMQDYGTDATPERFINTRRNIKLTLLIKSNF